MVQNNGGKSNASISERYFWCLRIIYLLEYINLNQIMKSVHKALSLHSGGRDDLVSWEALALAGKKGETSELD